MDQYSILIEALCKALTKKDEEIRAKATDLFYNKNEHTTYTRLKREIDEKLEKKETQKDILVNYNQIISGLKKKFASKLILKTLAMLVVTIMSIAATSAIPGINAFIYILSLLLEAAIVSGEIGRHQIQIESYRQLYENTTIEALEQELLQLREASCGLERQLERIAKKVTGTEEQLSALKYARAELFGQYSRIVEKRTTLFEQNRQISEEDLNKQYLKDEDVLKLERKLNNGENI